MTLETWIAFALAAAAMLAIPGPTILLLSGQSLGAGRRHALPLVAGVAPGDPTATTLPFRAGFGRGRAPRGPAMAGSGGRFRAGRRRRRHPRHAPRLSGP